MFVRATIDRVADCAEYRVSAIAMREQIIQ